MGACKGFIYLFILSLVFGVCVSTRLCFRKIIKSVVRVFYGHDWILLSFKQLPIRDEYVRFMTVSGDRKDLPAATTCLSTLIGHWTPVCYETQTLHPSEGPCLRLSAHPTNSKIWAHTRSVSTELVQGVCSWAMFSACVFEMQDNIIHSLLHLSNMCLFLKYIYLWIYFYWFERACQQNDWIGLGEFISVS